MNNGKASHPRAESLRIRKLMLDKFRTGVVAEAGLMAHGRGEAFDYLLGETTTPNALKAIEVASAALLLAKQPVISVNGNAAALVAHGIVQLAETVRAAIEVNLFYRSASREKAMRRLLEAAGARRVLGTGPPAAKKVIQAIGSERKRVDPEGIGMADVVLIPLEDGDRTEALVEAGKSVIAVDLNPLSRTAQAATITIVDNIVRAMPTLTEEAKRLKSMSSVELRKLVSHFDNQKSLAEAMTLIHQKLLLLANKPRSVRLQATLSTSIRMKPDTDLNRLRMAKRKRKLVMLTAHDYQTARVLGQSGIDLILVGDSLGMVFQGGQDTKQVSMEQMLYHAVAVARGAGTTPVIADMPIQSDRTVHHAVESAKMFLSVGVQGVKVEGNKTSIIRALLDQRIPVMGHVGLLPQTAKSYSVQGREPPEAEAILRDAIALDDLGVFAIVLECIPEKLSRQITDSVKASTIGIGAGKYCDGQILVTYDILGLLGAVKPKYVKEYADLTGSIKAAVSQFRLDVINGKYPDPKHTYH